MKFYERIKADREVFAALSPEGKRHFIWDYYKIPIIAAASIALLLILAAVMNIGRGDVAMYAVFVNSDASYVQTDPEPLNALLAQGGMDMTQKTIDITADLTLGQPYSEDYDGQTIQVLAALFGISGLDVFAADPAVFDRYAVQDAFVDLSLLIETELLESEIAQPYRYENSDGHTITGGILLKNGSILHQSGYFHSDVIIGVAGNAEHLDTAILFIRQLLAAAKD